MVLAALAPNPLSENVAGTSTDSVQSVSVAGPLPVAVQLNDDELEVAKLRNDVCNLEEKVSRMTDTYHREFSNLSNQMQDTAGSIQQGMATISEQMSEQANCIAKALPSLKKSVRFATPLIEAGEQNPE